VVAVCGQNYAIEGRPMRLPPWNLGSPTRRVAQDMTASPGKIERL
jgi:hypothetical protein